MTGSRIYARSVWPAVSKLPPGTRVIFRRGGKLGRVMQPIRGTPPGRIAVLIDGTSVPIALPDEDISVLSALDELGLQAE